jgi:hypothetical protein
MDRRHLPSYRQGFNLRLTLTMRAPNISKLKKYRLKKLGIIITLPLTHTHKSK